MKKFLIRLCAMLLVIATAFPCAGVSAAEESTAKAEPERESLVSMDYSGKTVIIHTNDVHGAIEGYAYVKGLKNTLEAKGAEVITVDCGDYSQGTIYVSIDSGKSAVTMMNAVQYDISTIGNHEFDYGYKQLKKNLKNAQFKVLCANTFSSKGKKVFEDNTVWTGKSGLKIGFFGLDTPEAMTKAHPAKMAGIRLSQGENLYSVAQAQIDMLKEDSDLVICLAHLGVDYQSIPNTSENLYNNTTGLDLILDGHSHTVMSEGSGGEPVQSTGSRFENIGIVVIDNASKQIFARTLIPMETVKELVTPDAYVAKKAAKIIKKIDKKYGEVFASSEVELNGEKAPGNRTEETNLGDLITDAMIWEVTKDKSGLLVDEDHVVAVMNGGGIRATIGTGDITMNDIKTVLPYGNTVAVIYVKGKVLLEALEASTYCTPDAIGGFPQVAGINYTVKTKKAFKQGEQYPDTTYYAPSKINRVKITGINGKAFDKNAVYAVVTNDFCASGGDTYYIFKKASAQFDTGRALDEVLIDYIKTVLGGVVGSEYADPQGRITIK